MLVLARLFAAFLAVALALALVLESGARGDDDPAIQRIMERVNARNRAIGKGLRITYAPDAAARKALAVDAASLIQLGKEARTLTGPARERKKSQQEWTRTVDGFLSASEELARVIASPESSQARVRQYYQKFQKLCIDCHRAFREEGN